ncbi:MAG: hypothetical protein U9N59_02485 [Campylobacterota bacterium]|nr:hypothetical protein [Campylobacterota bacterium]
MVKITLVAFLLVTGLYANTNLFYEVNKGGKSLGYYEINYNDKKNNLKTKSYGVANKVKFFVDKQINYVADGHRTVKFVKNKKIEQFNLLTKLDAIDKKTQDRYKRKLKKVKNNDMLLLTKKGKNSIELFNKRKVNILTLEEVLKLSLIGDIKEQNIILFDKFGVMKMIAKIIPTQDGYDIYNKSKKKNYIKIVTQNNIPVKVTSYMSDWSLNLYAYGEYSLNKISSNLVNNKAKDIIKEKLSNKKDITLDGFENIKIAKKGYSVYAKVSIKYPDDIKNSKKKKYCNITYKKYSKKASEKKYTDTGCTVVLKNFIPKKDVVESFMDELLVKHKQLKFTKKYKISKKGDILYKVMKKVK